MKVTINELNSIKRGMEVEIPSEKVTSELDKTFNHYRRDARIAGFRKGKIPLNVVKQRFGKQIEGEVITRLMEEYTRKALEEKELSPIHRPVLDEYDYRPGEPLVFRTTFEIRPQVDLKADYRKMKIKRKETKVTDEEVEETLGRLRERSAKYSTEEGRSAQDEDVVVGTLSGRYLEGSGQDFSEDAITMAVGSEDNHPDFNTALKGIAGGEERTFKVTYAKDYPAAALAGRVVEYVLRAKEVKVKELPPLDDELAREMGEFKDLGELREHIREELARRAVAQADAETKDKILTELVGKHDFEVPESMVEMQLDRQIEDRIRAMLMQGVDPKKAEIDWKEVREKNRPQAVLRVKAMLILEEIATRESIQIPADEFNRKLEPEAKRQNISVSELKEQLRQKGQLEGFKRQMTREKALDFLLDQATISREG